MAGADTIDSWDGVQDLATWPASEDFFVSDLNETLPFGSTPLSMVKTSDGSFWIAETFGPDNDARVRRVWPDGSMIVYPVVDATSPFTDAPFGYADLILATDGEFVWLAILATSQAEFPDDPGGCPIPDLRLLPGHTLAMAIFGSTGPSSSTYGISGDAFYIYASDPQQTVSNWRSGESTDPSFQLALPPLVDSSIGDTFPPIVGVFGFSACASPAEPGVCYVTWGEAGYAGNVNPCASPGPMGGYYKIRLSYLTAGTNFATQTDLLSATEDWSVMQIEQGSAPLVSHAYFSNIRLANDGGSPVAFVSMTGGYDTGGGLFIVTSPENFVAKPYIEMWDLSGASINVLQNSTGATPVDFDNILIAPGNFESTTFVMGPPFNGGLIQSGPVYDDPLLGGTPVYLVAVYYAPASDLTSFRRMILRVPVDGSTSFDFMDGNEAAATDPILLDAGFDFVSEPRNVWWPAGAVSGDAPAITLQYDRICSHSWVPDLESPGEEGILNVRGVDLDNNLLSFVSTRPAEQLHALTQQVILRNYYPCSQGMHVWDLV